MAQTEQRQQAPATPAKPVPPALIERDLNECRMIVFRSDYNLTRFGGSPLRHSLSPSDTIFARSADRRFMLARDKASGEEVEIPVEVCTVIYPASKAWSKYRADELAAASS